jgi:hypothetical protein
MLATQCFLDISPNTLCVRRRNHYESTTNNRKTKPLIRWPKNKTANTCNRNGSKKIGQNQSSSRKQDRHQGRGHESSDKQEQATAGKVSASAHCRKRNRLWLLATHENQQQELAPSARAALPKDPRGRKKKNRAGTQHGRAKA